MFHSRLFLLSFRLIGIVTALLFGTTFAQAVTITVTGTEDVLDPYDGVCTLREAIRTTHGQSGDCIVAGANTTPHEIILPAGTYTLTIPGIDEYEALTGDLNIPRYADVTITGAGRDVTIIDGNGLDRVFFTLSPSTTEIAGVTITGGYSPDAFPWGGGGLLVGGDDVVLRDCTVEGNSGHYARGGGILAYGGGNLTIINCLIRNNESYTGGGIDTESWNLRIIDSTIESNSAEGGGGISIHPMAESVVLVRSAVTGNSAGVSGGGIAAYGGVIVVNSTISGNTAGQYGGGLVLYSEDYTILSSTVTGNSASISGGGIHTWGNATVHNSIIAGNSPDDCDDALGPVSGGYNLFGRHAGCYDYGTTDIVTVEPSAVTTIVLGVLQNNDGPTPTHALLSGSPAIDAADPFGCLDENGDSLIVDQRGESRPVDGDGNGTTICDMGAYEAVVTSYPPTAVAASDAPVECSSIWGGLVTLDGSLSSDPESTPGTNDGIVEFAWYEDFGLPTEALLGVSEILMVNFALGDHAITLRVVDSQGLTDADEVVVSVLDTTPPEIMVSVNPALLWPPNHRLVDVTTTHTASDACGTVNIALVSVTSNEPDDAPGAGDGNTVADVQGADLGTADFHLMLRAERSGTGDGRDYVLTYSATDESGNSSEAETWVVVPLVRDGSGRP